MSQAARKAAVLLAILAMVFKGLVPAGWMPNPQGFDETALILCDMDGPMSAADMANMTASMAGMDMSSMEMSHSDDKQAPATGHSHDECPFAAAAHGGAAAAHVLAALPSLAVKHAHQPVAEQIVAFLARYQPQSPRAPPIFSV